MTAVAAASPGLQAQAVGPVAGRTLRKCRHARANHQHGDYAMYRLDGCRCYRCAAARSRYDEARTKAITAGTWQPFVDLGPVRDHISALKDLGLGDRQIAQLAGVNRKQVRDIAAGYRHDPGRGNPSLTKVRTETAARIFSVPADERSVPDGAYVDAACTWQQIEELLAAGWTKARIAQKCLGTKRPALQLSRDRITAGNARAVAELYRREIGCFIAMTEDVDQDDDSELDWVLVERVVAGQSVTLTRAERESMVRTLHHERGLTRTRIAELLSMSAKRVNRILGSRADGAA